MTNGPHDRLLVALADAGRRARVLGNLGCSIPDPLATTLRALSDVDFNALVTLASTITTHAGGAYVHVGLDAAPPPLKRLLLPFAYRTVPDSWSTDAASRTAIVEQLKAVDVEAWAALTSAIAIEEARRAS